MGIRRPSVAGYRCAVCGERRGRNFSFRDTRCSGACYRSGSRKTEVDLVSGDRKLQVECGAYAVLDECAGCRRAIAWVAFHPVQ